MQGAAHREQHGISMTYIPIALCLAAVSTEGSDRLSSLPSNPSYSGAVRRHATAGLSAGQSGNYTYGHKVHSPWIASSVSSRLRSALLIRSGEEATGQRSGLFKRRRPVDGFYPHLYAVWDSPSCEFHVQQVVGSGSCLFHSIAAGLHVIECQKRLPIHHAWLEKKAKELRLLSVKWLTAENGSTLLHLQDNETITAAELVESAASKYGRTSEDYCRRMLHSSEWGGGPEILALVNALQRPIHVYEPICLDDNRTVVLQECGHFGSPRFDSKQAINILAADDRFPDGEPTQIKLHGEGGNHFLALFPPSDNLTLSVDSLLP